MNNSQKGHSNPKVRKITRQIYKEFRADFERVEIFYGANREFAVMVREMAGFPTPVLEEATT